MTNRAYILAALAQGPSTVRNPLYSRDTALMAQALRALGVAVEEEDDIVRITPGEVNIPESGLDIDCGLAGTVMRFLPPLVAVRASGAAPVRIDGDEQARQRPMAAMLAALRQLGVDVDGDALPFVIRAQEAAGNIAGADAAELGGQFAEPAGGCVTIDASASSQFVSGLLLSAPRFHNGVAVTHAGGALPSMPHIDMTVDMLRQAGARVGVAGNTWTVHPGEIAAREWMIEPDLSNATPFLAAAMVAGGSVTVQDWPEHTTQPGDAFRDIASRMGATVELADAGLTVTGPRDGVLQGVDLDMGDIGELAPTVAALCALASTPSRLRGIAHLRGHETDRLAALAAELNELGGNVVETEDGLDITPAPLHGGTWHSYADHRMATAGAIIGLRTAGVEVEDIETTAKTLPGFAGMWEAMLHG